LIWTSIEAARKFKVEKLKHLYVLEKLLRYRGNGDVVDVQLISFDEEE
jgi:hypothetical protein